MFLIHTGLLRLGLAQALDAIIFHRIQCRIYRKILRKQKTNLNVVHTQNSQILDISTKKLSASMFKSLVFSLFVYYSYNVAFVKNVLNEPVCQDFLSTSTSQIFLYKAIWVRIVHCTQLRSDKILFVSHFVNFDNILIQPKA